MSEIACSQQFGTEIWLEEVKGAGRACASPCDFFLTAWTVGPATSVGKISHCSSPTPFLGIVSLRGYLIFSVRCTRGSNAAVERTGGEARCLVYQSLDSETPLSSGESTRTTRNYVNFRNAKDTWCRSRFT